MACAVSLGSVLTTKIYNTWLFIMLFFINHSLDNGYNLVPYAVVSGHAKVQVIIFWLLTMSLRFNPN
jgi:hypothetical protein